MKTFKMFADFDKEEAWLNDMAAQGWLLTKSSVLYTFAPIAPGSAVVRIDYRETMKQTDFDDYRNLFWDAGWRHLSGTRGSGAQYFASFGAAPDAEIFSDPASKAQRYKRAMAMSSAILLPILVILVALWSAGSMPSLLPPQDLYLTPGLWEMEGGAFWRAFLFETPFALLRASGPLLLLGGCVAIVAVMAYQYALYRRALTRA